MLKKRPVTKSQSLVNAVMVDEVELDRAIAKAEAEYQIDKKVYNAPEVLKSLRTRYLRAD